MYFVVTRERGSSWDQSRSMPEQKQWVEDAAFMNGLADDGFVVLGGPVGDGTRILLIVDAESRESIRLRLAEDPWTPLGLLPVTKVEAWQILLSAGKGPAAPEDDSQSED